MAPRKEVTFLQDWCLQTLQSHLTTLIQNYTKSEQQIPFEESKLNKIIKKLVYNNLPVNTHERFVELRLLQIVKMFDLDELYRVLIRLHDDANRLEEIFLSPNFQEILERSLTDSCHSAASDQNMGRSSPDQNIGRSSRERLPVDEERVKELVLFRHLMPPFTLLKVKTFNVDNYPSCSYHIIQIPYFLVLGRMTNLESFTKCLPGFLAVNGLYEKFTNNIKALSNLTSFSLRAWGSDQMLAVISEHCKSIQDIDVHISSKVTDSGVKYLTKCEKLRSVNLDGTNVSAAGFFELLTQAQSSDLTQVLGFQEHVRKILNQLQHSAKSLSVSPLRQLHYSGVSAKNLCVVSRYFPHLTELSLELTSKAATNIGDFSSVFSIETLKKVALLFLHQSLDKIRQLLARPPLATPQTSHQGPKTNIYLDCSLHYTIVSSLPCLTEISLKFFNIGTPVLFDFPSIFDTRTLKKVDLQFERDKNFDAIHKIVSACPLVTSLALRHGHNSSTLDLNSSLLATVALCPNIGNLTIGQMDLCGVATFNSRIRLAVNPFQKLKTLKWTQMMTVPFAEYILCLATNIECFEFYPYYHAPDTPWPYLTDKFFESVLEQNPLKELRHLYLDEGHSLSLDMLKRIISSCEKLACLNIDLSRGDKKALEKFISNNNYAIETFISTEYG